MKLLILKTILLFFLVPAAVNAVPRIVQSRVVNFPVNGRVIVQAREELGKFPQMLFISAGTGRVLLQSRIKDDLRWLIPGEDDLSPSNLRFCTIRGEQDRNPLVMSLATYHGGSDSEYFMTAFGEVNGKIKRLNARPLTANIQGGFYLGYLNRKLGYGVASWTFIWGDGIDEGHYSAHHYQMDIYRLQGGKLKQIVSKTSKKMYDFDAGALCFGEMGIKVFDQRRGVPDVILE